MAESIGIFTPNPNDITVEEAEELAKAIRSEYPNYEVHASGREREGLGVTFFEVLRMSLTGGAAFGVGKIIAEEVIKKLTDISVEWARERFKRRKHPSKRPVYVAIYGPDGVLKSTVIKNATDEPEDRTAKDRELEAGADSRKKEANNES